MPNRQKSYMNTRTSKGDYTKPQQPYDTTKQAKQNGYHPNTSQSKSVTTAGKASTYRKPQPTTELTKKLNSYT